MTKKTLYTVLGLAAVGITAIVLLKKKSASGSNSAKPAEASALQSMGKDESTIEVEMDINSKPALTLGELSLKTPTPPGTDMPVNFVSQPMMCFTGDKSSMTLKNIVNDRRKAV